MHARLLTEENQQYLLEDYQGLLEVLVTEKLTKHPLPWRSASPGNVHDGNGTLVAVFAKPHLAHVLIECAETMSNSARDADVTPLFPGLFAAA